MFYFGRLLPLLLILAGGEEAESLIWTRGLPLPLLAGGGEGELREGLPLPLLAGGGGEQGGGSRIGSSVCELRAGLPIPLLAG